MTGQVIFDPLLPWLFIGVGSVVAALMVAAALWRSLSGWWLRALASAVLLGAIAQPSVQTEERRAQSDIVILVIDESASQKIADRAGQTAAAVARIEAEVAALGNTELRKIVVADDPEDGGTLAMTALAMALAEEPRARVAGAIVISDGQVHDLDIPVDMPAPLNVLLTGQKTDWDRRLMVRTAPTFGIIGEEMSLTLRVDEQGAVPTAEVGREVTLKIAIDGGPEQLYAVPVGVDLDLPLTLEHGGQNVVQVTLETVSGELTDRNNAAVIQINGVRDRLRVLLVSGEPYAGERTWRNLLKSDSAVDLVHFTILRPPDKQDGVPVSELSLIAFPTRELFVDKISEFDLIIFDRYQLRGILPASYLENIRTYVEEGGAVLVSAGPDFASVESIYHSGLGRILPARPTARVLDEGYLPRVSDIGQRHPVTAGLEEFAPEGGKPGTVGAPSWGRWLRIVELADAMGQTVMEGPEARPLLVLNRVGEGRVALLASDNAWLWGRGFEGGGPQLELLRRLAHWMMKEPDLEEEALTATADGQTLSITRRSLTDGAREVTVTAPDGTETVVQLPETAPGRYTADWVAPDIGLYRLSDGEIDRVMALGPAAPREFEETIATDQKLMAFTGPTNGGFLRLAEGSPDIRAVREGRPAIGRGWIGVTPRNAYQSANIRVIPILPAWAFLLLAACLSIAAWIYEGRR